MDCLLYCKLCLVTDVKMYNMKESSLAEAYYKLLHHLPAISLDETQHVCYECAALLIKYKKFQSKCSKAHVLLTYVRNTDGHYDDKIIKDYLDKLDRKQYKLESPLTLAPIKTYTDPCQLIRESKDCNDEDEKCIVIKIEPTDDPVPEENNEKIDVKIENNIQKENVALNNKTQSDSEFNEYISDNSDNESVLNPVSHKKIIKNQRAKKRNKQPTKTKKRQKVQQNKVKSINLDLRFEENESVQKCLSDDEPLAKRLSRTEECNESITVNALPEKTLETKGTDKAKPTVKKRTGSKFDANCYDAKVVLLTPEEAMKEVLLRKESTNYLDCEYKCDLCYRGFEAKTAFENHKKKHSLEFGELECSFCHLRFPHPKALKKHEHASHKRKFYCKVCPYICFSTTRAKTHMSLHKGKKYPCDQCGENFSFPNSLLMHQRVKHVTECVCDLCGSTFGKQRGLYIHKKLLHRQETNEEKGPKCEECGIQFATETAWKRHLVLSTKHKDIISNGCENCGETFPDEEALRRHTKVHAPKQKHRAVRVIVPAPCTICNKRLATLKEYKAHMTSQHPQSETARRIELRERRRVCEVCGKKFKYGKEYKTHVTSQHPQSQATKRIDARERRQYVCEVCGKEFKSQCFLLYHKVKHTGERPYECGECGKKFAFPGTLSTHKTLHAMAAAGARHECDTCQKVFSSRSGLNKHVKAHLGIRPHKCPICDKAFPNPCDVKMHLKYVHYKEPWPKRDRSKRSAQSTESTT